MNGPCAKTVVRCFIVAKSGDIFIGENECENPQSVCPRELGEGYEKCASICRQVGHAEEMAVRLAGEKCVGAHAYLQGHTYACMHCQHKMFGAGVAAFSIGEPP